MEEGKLVQHKNVRAILARVQGPDPTDVKKVLIKLLSDNRIFSCPKEDLEVLGA